MPDTVRLHARVNGLVQGVSFRYDTLKRGQALGLTGYVRNRWDGSVEVVAEGQAEAVEQLLSWLHVGPPSAQVDEVDVEWESPLGEFRQFEVRV